MRMSDEVKSELVGTAPAIYALRYPIQPHNVRPPRGICLAPYVCALC